MTHRFSCDSIDSFSLMIVAPGFDPVPPPLEDPCEVVEAAAVFFFPNQFMIVTILYYTIRYENAVYLVGVL